MKGRDSRKRLRGSSPLREDQPCDDTWGTNIPREILLSIFQYLVCQGDVRQLSGLSLVCRLWHRIASDPLLWRRIDLSYGWVKDTSTVLDSLYESGRLAKLMHLDISGSKQGNSQLLENIGVKFPTLRSLNISACLNLKNEGLLALARGLTHLQCLDAEGICQGRVNITSGLTELIHSQQRSLESVNIGGPAYHSLSSVLKQVSALHHLTCLDISRQVISRNISLRTLLSGVSKHLQILRMCQCDFSITREITEDIPLPELRELSAAALQSHPFSLTQLISASTKLKYLDLRYWPTHKLTALNDLVTATSLQSLNIAYASSSIHHSFIPLSLANVSASLHRLDLSWCTGWSERQLEGVIDDIVSHPRELMSLLCAGMPVTADHVRKLLWACRNLECLDLTSCKGLKRGIKRKYNGLDQLAAVRKLLMAEEPFNNHTNQLL